MSERLSPHTLESLRVQTESRAHWVEHDTVEAIDAMILHEGITELDEAVELCQIGASAFILASEIGDVFYLLAKRQMLTSDQLPENVQSVVNHALQVADDAGIDINSAVVCKIVRNDIKYLHNFTNNGYGYDGGVSLSKQQYRMMGGDEVFSEMYLQLADNLVL